MTMRNLIAKLQATWRGFRRAEGGNTIVVFGLSMIPIVGLVGAAVDYSRASNIRTAMQAAADSTALAMATSASGQTADQLSAAASSFFKSIFTRPDADNVTVTTTYTTTSGTQLVLNATASMKSDIMGVMGFKNIPIAVSSTAAWGMSRLRVSLVLDNTGSMADAGKITALKTAATNLVNQLQAAAVNNGDVYVSIIPFNKDVNVGAVVNVSAPWINWKLWDSVNLSSSSTSSSSSSSTTSATICWNGVQYSWNGSSFTVLGTCAVSSNTICWNGTTYTWTGTAFSPGGSCGTTTTTTTSTPNRSAWNGCITDRDQNYDTTNTAPNPSDVSLAAGIPSTLFPAEQYSMCPIELMPLSYDWTALKNKIAAMTPNGFTNQAIGLAWGWESLTQGNPLNAPAEDASYQYQKVIILLTDGLNTENRWTTDQATIDARQQLLCNNIKAAGITIYTIQVNTGTDPTSTLLRNCATDASKWFVLTSASQIVTVFNQIGTNLSKLRVAR